MITHPNYLFLLALPLSENYPSLESQQTPSNWKIPQCHLAEASQAAVTCCGSHCVGRHVFALPLLCVIIQHFHTAMSRSFVGILNPLKR